VRREEALRQLLDLFIHRSVPASFRFADHYYCSVRTEKLKKPSKPLLRADIIIRIICARDRGWGESGF
jgi:hypothetical protein